jgi:hypothetical protein
MLLKRAGPTDPINLGARPTYAFLIIPKRIGKAGNADWLDLERRQSQPFFVFRGKNPSYPIKFFVQEEEVC